MKLVSHKTLVIATGILALGYSTSEAVSFDFSSVPLSKIVFDGAGNFKFAPGAPKSNFQVDDGTAAGLFGSLDGIFTIGAVTTVGPLSTAPVTGTGTFTIKDGATPLTASITLDSLSQLGTGSILNVDGAVNVTGVSYAGTNPDLVALRDDATGSAAISFQFILAFSIDYMKTHKMGTSFSGSIASVPDIGATAGLLGLGFAGLAAVRRRQTS